MNIRYKFVNKTSQKAIDFSNILQVKEVDNFLECKRGAVAVFGGDGTLNRFLRNVQLPVETNIVLYPCGTSNGVASSIVTNCFPIRVMNIHGNSNIARAILSIGWGMIADFDNIAERRTRNFGILRCIILSFLPIYIIGKSQSYTGSLTMKEIYKQPNIHIFGTFQMVHICNLPFLAHDFMVSVNHKLFKDYMCVIVAQNCSRMDLLKAFYFFSDVHRTSDFGLPESVKLYWCKKVQMRTLSGSLVVDGEESGTSPIISVKRSKLGFPISLKNP